VAPPVEHEANFFCRFPDCRGNKVGIIGVPAATRQANLA
jgi:hypothetical protein